ncbi:MAG: MurR/RpiR family transcriptional regulator [Chloroflexi bacterium]|nr:MurR/RpiR family transcriptional regulator [Chloroflexota bacterium]
MFRERIQSRYGELTPSFRRLADFLLQDQLDAAFMTATEMAHHLDVDAATVVRFAQTLGYSGFRQLIKEVQRIVKSELLASYSPTLTAVDDAGLLRNLLENERHNLGLAQARVTSQANSILPMLAEAKRIWVVGQGKSADIAALCAATLREVGLPAASLAADPVTAADSLMDPGPDTVVIGFALTGMELDVANVVTLARSRGARTLALSASETAGVVLAAETSIVCPGRTHTQVSSFAGLAAISGALAAAYAARHPEKVTMLQEARRDSYRSLVELRAESVSRVNVEELWRQF